MAIFEVLNNQQSYFNRYFRRNEGSTDYATIPEVTLAGDFVIEFDLWLGLVTQTSLILGNAQATTDWIGLTDSSVPRINVSGTQLDFNTLAFDSETKNRCMVSRAGSNITFSINGVSEILTFNSTNFSLSTIMAGLSPLRMLSGILANLKIYDAGTLVRDYPLDDNSDTIRDKVNGQNGTVINGNADDWGLFDKQADGDWLGQELVVNGGFDSDSDWTLQADWSISGGRANLISDGTPKTLQQTPVLSNGLQFRISFDVETDGADIGMQGLGGTIIAGLAGNSGTVSADWKADTIAIGFKRVSGSPIGYIDNVSAKEVLKNA